MVHILKVGKAMSICKFLIKYSVIKIMFISFLPLVIGCVDQKSQILKDVEQWHGKKIVLPLKTYFSHYGRDSVNYDYSKYPYKVIVFISKGECISCKFNIKKWQEMIYETDSISLSKVGFIFILEPIYKHEIYTMLKSYQFQTPIFIDTNNWFRTKNGITDCLSHVWLIDPDNRIIYIGDPTINKKINEEYMNLIAEKYLYNN